MIRVGFLGGGWATRNIWVPCVESVENCSSCALFEPNASAQAALPDSLKGILAESFDALLERSPDLIVIASPNHLHAEQAIFALRRGYSVLVEKPAALGLAEAREMARAAKQGNAGLWVSRASLERDDIRSLRQAVSEGTLGQIRCIDVSWVRAAGVPGRGSWFTKRAEAGGGVGLDLGTHMLEIALDLLGYPRPVAALSATSSDLSAGGGGQVDAAWRGKAIGGKIDVEVQMYGAVLIEGGILLRVTFAWASHRRRDETTVAVWGSQGEMELRTTFGFSNQGIERPSLIERRHGQEVDRTSPVSPALAPYERFLGRVVDEAGRGLRPDTEAFLVLSETLELLYSNQWKRRAAE